MDIMIATDSVSFSIPPCGNAQHNAMRCDLNWTGEYIKGESWCRGSLLELNPIYGKIIEQKTTFNYETELYDLWNQAEDHIKSDTPKDLLNIIKRMTKIDPKMSNINIIGINPSTKSLWCTYTHLHDMEMDSTRYVIEFYNGNDIEIMEKIKDELEQVIKYGVEHKINFVWI